VSGKIHADRHIARPPGRVTCPGNDGVQCPQPSRRPCSAPLAPSAGCMITLLLNHGIVVLIACWDPVAFHVGQVCDRRGKIAGTGPVLRADIWHRIGGADPCPGRGESPARHAALRTTVRSMLSDRLPSAPGSRAAALPVSGSHTAARVAPSRFSPCLPNCSGPESLLPLVHTPLPHPLPIISPPPWRRPGGERITGRGGGRKATLPGGTAIMRALKCAWGSSRVGLR
jgi:hypothetical protein